MNIQEDEKDRLLVCQWMKVDNLAKLHFTIEKQPINRFISQIEEMEASYPLFPKELKRTQRIIQEINKSSILFPVYIDRNDSSLFVMEGRHRLVAFKRMGFSVIPVAVVSYAYSI